MAAIHESVDWEADSSWNPEDSEELIVRTLFELNARTIEMQAEIQEIRRLLEDDDEEDEANGD
jgi:hypothetical protein